MAITLNQALGLTPSKRCTHHRDVTQLFFTMLRITRSNMIGELKVAMVEPLDLHVSNRTGACVPENRGMPTTAECLQGDLVVTGKEARVVAQSRFLTVLRLHNAGCGG